MGRCGNALTVRGLLALAWGVLWQRGVAPGSRTVLPQPVALERAGAAVREVAAAPPIVAPRPTVAPQPTVSIQRPEPTLLPPPLAVPTAAPITLIAADVADRAQTSIGYALRLPIPTINLDTPAQHSALAHNAPAH